MFTEDADFEVSVDGDFPCGSAGEIRVVEPGRFEVGFKAEQIPDWFQVLLDGLFGGGGVPKDYMAHVRVTNNAGETLRVGLRFLLSPKGCPYMFPPWWVRRESGWDRIPDKDTLMCEGEFVETTVDIAPGECIRVASAPYEEPEEVVRKARHLAETNDIWTYREIGTSAQGRPLPLIESALRPLKLLVTASMQSSEPVSWGIMHVAHWLTIPTTRARSLLDQIQFFLMPMLNPDGVFEGRSVTNAVGEVPKFGINRLVEGKEAPRETEALWTFLIENRPHALTEVHAHYTPVDFTRSVGMHDKDSMPDELKGRGAVIEQAIFENFHAPPLANRKVLVDPRRPEHNVYGDKYIAERAGCVQTWLQAVPDTIESHCADVREMVETMAKALIDWDSSRA